MTVEHLDGDGDALILRKAVREALLKFTEVTTEPDPAPWFQVDSTLVEMFSEGDEQGFIRRKKLERRVTHSLQIALLSGELIAQFSDSGETCDVPGWAWQGAEWHDNYWFDSRLPIDPFMPDEWYRWSGHDISVDRNALNDWLARTDLGLLAEPPVFPAPHDEANRPQPITKRLPRDAAFVTISEAVSWIAFGVSMDQGRLSLALEGMGIDRAKSQRAVNDAMAKLADLGTGGKIAMRGKYVPNYLTDDRPIQTEPIDPVRLMDFAQFDILHEGLQFGQGLAWFNDGTPLDTLLGARDDAFRCVTVSRADLMEHWPTDEGPRPPVMRALIADVPATIDGIGEVQKLIEAIAQIAFGKPSDDTLLFQDGEGNLIVRHADGSPVTLESGAAKSAVYRTGFDQTVTWLRSGELPAYIIEPGKAPVAISRLNWNSVESVDALSLYNDLPVLVSKEAVLRLSATRQAAKIQVQRGTVKLDCKPNVRKRPGPARDSKVVTAIATVKENVIRAGYRAPLEHGQLQAIKDLLRGELTKAGIERDDRSLRKYAGEVKSALPRGDSSEGAIRP